MNPDRVRKTVLSVIAAIALYFGGVGVAYLTSPDKYPWGLGVVFAMIGVGVTILVSLFVSIWWDWVRDK